MNYSIIKKNIFIFVFFGCLLLSGKAFADDKPVITSVNSINKQTDDGTVLNVTLTATSITPIVNLNKTFQHPENISLKNEGQMQSDIWPDEVSIEVNNQQQVSTPNATPSGGEVFLRTQINLTATTDGATIYYTTDGTDPVVGAQNTQQYNPNSPIIINAPVTIKAIGEKDGMATSEAVTAIFTISASQKVATPIAYPTSCAIPIGTIIRLTSTTPESTIYYTIDGSTPLTPSTVSLKYNESTIISISKPSTIKAVAVKSDMMNSELMTTSYSISSGYGGGGPSPPSYMVASPIFDPSYREISVGSKVILTTVTPGANVYYTIDGSEPNPGVTGTILYNPSTPIIINTSCTIKAIAVKDGMNNSAIKMAVYTMINAIPVNYTVYINGNEVHSDAGFYESNNIVLGSLRCLAESMRLQAIWNDATKQITLSSGNNTLIMTINSNRYTFNDTEHDLPISPLIINGRTFVPLQTVVESFGGTFRVVDKGIDECFIATAAFGSKFEPSVALLRHFRDHYLLTNDIGAAFVNFYYHNSPPIAAYIANSEPLKTLVRLVLLPVIAVVYSIFHPIIRIGFVCILILILLKRWKSASVG